MRSSGCSTAAAESAASAGVAPDLALNTAASFTTNTNWQAYVPETTMSYLTQMLALAYHNFFSAAVGIALAIALIRGISRRESKTLGNFWVDTTRASLWVLLPGCVIYALLLVSQGVVQNLRPYDQAKLLEPQTVTTTGSRWESCHPDGYDADDRAGAGGIAGSDQDAGDEWRRLLQCEQRASV